MASDSGEWKPCVPYHTWGPTAVDFKMPEDYRCQCGEFTFAEGKLKFAREELMKVQTLIGHSLRDYFAAKAMDTVTTFMGRKANHEGFIGNSEAMQIAVNAYAIADAMLKARANV